MNSPKHINNMKDLKKTISFAIILIFGLISLTMWGCPQYGVWRAELSGKAEFVKAEQNRKIKIEEAKANLEAEKLNAQAEIEQKVLPKLSGLKTVPSAQPTSSTSGYDNNRI